MPIAIELPENRAERGKTDKTIGGLYPVALGLERVGFCGGSLVWSGREDLNSDPAS